MQDEYGSGNVGCRTPNYSFAPAATVASRGFGYRRKGELVKIICIKHNRSNTALYKINIYKQKCFQKKNPKQLIKCYGLRNELEPESYFKNIF